MYSNVSSCVKYKDKLSKYFKVYTGSRQGCYLSPSLFKIFVDDIFDAMHKAKNHPITINDSKIYSLMYADDLVLEL